MLILFDYICSTQQFKIMNVELAIPEMYRIVDHVWSFLFCEFLTFVAHRKQILLRDGQNKHFHVRNS